MPINPNLIILDRDGVINWEISTDHPESNNGQHRIKTPEEWQELPGSLDAIVKLNQAGFIICVATNQSIIAKNIITMDGLDQIHNKMQQKLAAKGGFIDRIFVCPHHENEHCGCRKPQPGMLLAAAKAYNIDPTQQLIPFVGDSYIDLLAAVTGGFLPILVKTGKGKITLDKLNNNINNKINNLLIFDDLNKFADYWILKILEKQILEKQLTNGSI